MNFKIDTKEKFHVITIEDDMLSANVTEEISHNLLSYLNDDIKNIVVNMEYVQQIDEPAGRALVNILKAFYEQNCSMVVCCMKPEVEKFLEEKGLLELMNNTPTESEAWDIVQMEEIEREFLE